MSNKKKIILFLGAVSLIAFGNYKQFTKNKAQTTVEGKTSEKATSSANWTAKEGKNSERATSSSGNNQKPQNNGNPAEAKSAQQPQNKPVNQNEQGENEKKSENNQNPNTQQQPKNSGDLKLDDTDVKDKFKLDTSKK